MKVAHLILAHDAPERLGRLTAALDLEKSHSFIHIDSKSSISPFRAAVGDRATFLEKRTAVYWGHYSTIEATLQLIRHALDDARGFDRFVLLSGACYPLRSSHAQLRFYEAHPHAEFINLVQMPAVEERKPLTRLIEIMPHPGSTPMVRFSRRVLRKLRLSPTRREDAYRRVMGHLIPFAGDQWWALTRRACETIVEFMKREERVVQFMTRTFFSEEMIFQIILGNSPLRGAIRRNLTFTDWSDPAWWHPATLTARHIDALFDQDLAFPPEGWYGPGPMLYARKFSDDDRSLFDIIRARQELRDQRASALG